MTDLELALEFLCENRGTLERELGPAHMHTDLHKQIRYYECAGCTTKHESSWPEWWLTFIHSPDCKFEALMRVLDRLAVTQTAEPAK